MNKKQLLLGFLLLFFWCVCLSKVASILIIYIRCILRLIRYYITIFYANVLYSLLSILHKFVTPRWAIFIGFLGYSIKNEKTSNSTSPRSMLFSETIKLHKKTKAAMIAFEFFYLFIISILYNNHIRLWTVSPFFSVVILRMVEPIYPFSEICVLYY